LAAGIPARLSAADGRKFGLTVGGAFLVLAAVAFWRGRATTTAVLGSLGAALVLAALVAPTALGPVERAWMGLARAISKVTTPIVMGVVYFVVFTPFALAMRVAGRDALWLRRRGASTWVPRPADQQRGDLRRQF
jgi:hypothetical protein